MNRSREQQKILREYWNGSITAQLKKKEVKEIKRVHEFKPIQLQIDMWNTDNR